MKNIIVIGSLRNIAVCELNIRLSYYYCCGCRINETTSINVVLFVLKQWNKKLSTAAIIV